MRHLRIFVIPTPSAAEAGGICFVLEPTNNPMPSKRTPFALFASFLCALCGKAFLCALCGQELFRNRRTVKLDAITDFPLRFCYLPVMGRALSMCGIILAAGESSRMGSDKALLPWPPVVTGQVSEGTFLSAAIRSLTLSTDMVIVVAGKNADTLAPIVYANGASMVVNPAPERGQFSSLQGGLRQVLNQGRDAAVVTLVDRPPLSPAAVERLCAAFADVVLRWKWAVIPQYAGKHGHPILLAREMIEAFLRAPATAIARDIVHENEEHIEYVDVEEPMVAANINTPEEYAALQSAMRMLRD